MEMDSPASGRIGARRRLIAAALLLLPLALIYGRVGGFDYASIDDPNYVFDLEPVRAGLTLQGVVWAFTAFHMSNWHPLTWISHMIDVSLFGLDPGPQHLVNVAFHAVNSLLVYALSLVLLRRWSASVVAAYLFLAHPLHVESVAWIAERKDLLCGLFFISSVLLYLRYVERPGALRYLWVVGAFALALLSKPMAVTLPLVLLLLDFWPLNRFGFRSGANAESSGRSGPSSVRLLAEKAPLFLLSLASGLLTLAAVAKATTPAEHLPVAHRFMNAVAAYATYVRDVVMPTRLAVIYPLQKTDMVRTFLPAAAAVGVISAMAVVLRKKHPWLLSGWLWFVVMLLPVIGFIQAGIQSHADRYTYLPSIGLFLALGAELAQLKGAALKRVLAPLAALLILYSFLAWVQVGYWASPYLLFTRDLDVVGDNCSAHVNLSNYYLKLGLQKEAEFHAQKAISVSPEASVAYANLGVVFLAKKDYANAERMFRMALSKEPNNASMLHRLGISLEEQGRKEEAAKCFAAAKELDPSVGKAKDNSKRARP